MMVWQQDDMGQPGMARCGRAAGGAMLAAIWTMAAVLMMAAVMAVATLRAARAFTVFDPSNYAANSEQLTNNVRQVAIQTALQYAMDKASQTLGLPGPINTALMGMAGRMMLSSTGTIPGLSLNSSLYGSPGSYGANSVSGYSLGTMGTGMWSGQPAFQSGYSRWGNSSYGGTGGYGSGAGEWLSLGSRGVPGTGLSSADANAVMRSGMQVGAALLSRGVGQSATWSGPYSMPSYAYIGGRSSYMPSNNPYDSFTTPANASAFTRSNFQRPAVSTTPPDLRALEMRRAREWGEAALDLHAAANFSLSAANKAAERAEALSTSIGEARDLRQQMAVMTQTVIAQIETLEGLRYLLASMAREQAARALAAQPVAVSGNAGQIGSIPIPGVMSVAGAAGQP